MLDRSRSYGGHIDVGQPHIKYVQDGKFYDSNGMEIDAAAPLPAPPPAVVPEPIVPPVIERAPEPEPEPVPTPGIGHKRLRLRG